MTYDLRFLPEVEEDVIAGYSWYEEKARGLGDEFIVFGLFHCARDPRTIRLKLSDRDI